MGVGVSARLFGLGEDFFATPESAGQHPRPESATALRPQCASSGGAPLLARKNQLRLPTRQARTCRDPPVGQRPKRRVTFWARALGGSGGGCRGKPGGLVWGGRCCDVRSLERWEWLGHYLGQPSGFRGQAGAKRLWNFGRRGIGRSRMEGFTLFVARPLLPAMLPWQRLLMSGIAPKTRWVPLL